MLKRSVECFVNQTHGRKELIAVNQGSAAYFHKVDKFLSTLNANITHVRVSSYITLGEMRNEGIRHSRGEYICVWDDDDVYGDQRLSYQLSFLEQTNAYGTMLKNFVMVDSRLFSRFPQRRNISYHRGGLDGTLLCRNPKFSGVTYADKQQGEDTDFIDALKEKGCMFLVLNNDPLLYEYRWHGKFFRNNTTSRKNYEGLLCNKAASKVSFCGEKI
jgi:glycosyltransferase involved in cell wall biosynthesis